MAVPLGADAVALKTGERLKGRLRLDENQDLLIEAEHGNYRIKIALLQKATFGLAPFRLILQSGKMLVVHPSELSQEALITRDGTFPTDIIRSLYPLPPDETPDR